MSKVYIVCTVFVVYYQIQWVFIIIGYSVVVPKHVSPGMPGKTRLSTSVLATFQQATRACKPPEYKPPEPVTPLHQGDILSCSSDICLGF